MKTKIFIFICVAIISAVGHWAMAQSSWNYCGHATMQSPNKEALFTTTRHTAISTTSHITRVGSAGASSMASTTYDQEPQITNRRNSDDPFGGGSLDQDGEDNPLEPGTPIGEMPIMLLLAFVALYAIRQKRSVRCRV